MVGRKDSASRMFDIFIVALLLTIQLPVLPSIIFFLIYVWMTDEVFDKVLQPYCRRR